VGTVWKSSGIVVQITHELWWGLCGKVVG